MGKISDVVLYTERLILRPYCPEDAENVFRVVSRKEIAATTLMIPHPYPRAKVDWWINFTNNCRQKGTACELGIFVKDTGAYIGNTGFPAILPEHRNAEIAYFIDPDRWNQGYGTEACRRVVQFGFEMLELERIYGKCMFKNVGSRRIMEKSGLLLEGIARHGVCKWGQFEDICHFGLIRADWARQGDGSCV
jgi:ribosomal-protein-alanine N-acetyltransferase